MMIEHKIGRFVHRHDPLFIAHLVQMKRAEMGEFVRFVAPVEKRARRK